MVIVSVATSVVASDATTAGVASVFDAEPDAALVTLTLRRGHDGWSAQLHVYDEHTDSARAEVGSVKDGRHVLVQGKATLAEALTDLAKVTR